MSKNVQMKLSRWNRVAVGSIAALVIILSIAAGLVTRQAVRAQSRKPITGVVAGVPGAVSGGIPGGIPGGISGWVSEFPFVDQDKLIERLDQAPEVAVEFRNSAKAPLVITDAKVKAIPRERDVPGDEFAVLPVITVVNNTDRRIWGFTLEFRNGLERRAYYEAAPAFIAPHAAHTSGVERRFFILVGGPNGWTVRVAGVMFEGGDVWGVVPPPPPPPPPPAEFKIIDRATEIASRFTNREGAPLSITSATVKAARIASPAREGPDSNSEERYLIKLTVQLVNNTGRRISGVAIEYPSSESTDWMRTYSTVKIEPHESYKLESPQPEAPGYGALFFRGNPERMDARVMGVKFEDGDLWGSFPSPSPPHPPPAPPVLSSGSDDPKLIRKSGAVLMSSALHRVEAEYPPLARAARVSGSVVVEVIVDEAGAVVSARAISGHPLLRDAAVSAARQWQFSPTTVSGGLVRVVGTLTFNFEP